MPLAAWRMDFSPSPRLRGERWQLWTIGRLRAHQPCGECGHHQREPKKIILMPTKRPIAQLAELGQPCQIR